MNFIKSKPVRWLIKGLVLLVLFGGLLIAILLGLLVLDHYRQTILPTPTGPFVVGRTLCVWNDPSGLDPMAPVPNTHRQLIVWIWYPATDATSSQPQADYLPSPWRIAVERRQGFLISHLLTRDLSRVQTHAIADADLSPAEPKYPVILMRAGLAALTADYTSLAEDLASHGYIVVGFDAPYRSFVAVLPDGTVIPRAPQNDADLLGGSQQQQLADKLLSAWTSDTHFALDELTRLNASDPTGRFRGRLDLQRVGAFGHSLGGATSLQFCHDDPRCKAGIDIDGAPIGSVVADGIAQPFMFLMGDHTGESNSDPNLPESIRNAGVNIQSIYNHLPKDRRMMLTIHGANHYLFSDNGALLKSPILMRLLHAVGVVRIDGRRQLKITADSVREFFDVYLKGEPRAMLTNPSQFPEVEAYH